MAKVEIGAAIFVFGEPHAIGDILDVDSGTAKYLIGTGKATAVVEAEPEQPKPQPTPKRRTAQPAPATTED